MSLNIIEPTVDFDFSPLNITSPIQTNTSNLITKIVFHNRPLYVYSPKSFIKNNKKYCDLIYNHDDIIFIQWLESLEQHIKQLLLLRANKEKWFIDLLDDEDIEEYFHSVIKTQKIGRFIVRINNIKPDKKFFNNYGAITSLSDIHDTMFINSILSIQSIRLSKESFHLDIEFMQGNIEDNIDLFNESRFIPKSKKQEPIEKFEEVIENKKVQFFEQNNNIKENDNYGGNKHDQGLLLEYFKPNQEDDNFNKDNIKHENDQEFKTENKENIHDDEQEFKNIEENKEQDFDYENKDDEYSDALGEIDFDDLEPIDLNNSSDQEEYLELYQKIKEDLLKKKQETEELFSKYQESKQFETNLLSELTNLEQKYGITKDNNLDKDLEIDVNQ